MNLVLKSLITPRRISLIYFPPIHCKFLRHRQFTTSNVIQVDETRPEQKLSRLRRLLSELDWFIGKNSDYQSTSGFIHRALDRYKFGNDSPFIVYEKVVSFLIDKGRLREALSVYDRMHKHGYVASSFIDAKMLTVSAKGVSDSDMEPLLDAFRLLFTNPEFTEDQLGDVLKSLASFDASPQLMLAVMDQYFHVRGDFISSPDITERLVDAKASVGDVEGALDAIVGLAQSGDTSLDETILNLYNNLISTIRRTRVWDIQSITTVLEFMKENGIQPSITIFNTLISRAVQKRDYRTAFPLYSVIKALSRTGKVLPDASTFSTLFSALTQQFTSRKAHRRFRRSGPIDVVPRQLYQDMISFTKSPRKLASEGCYTSLELTTSLLHAALRTFMVTQDYAGAFIVLRTFSVFNLQVNVKTYAIIFRHIVSRVQSDLKGSRRQGDSRWGDRFIGIIPPCNLKILQDLDVEKGLSTQLLSLTRKSSFNLSSPIDLFSLTRNRTASAPPDLPDTCEKYNVPTLTQLAGRAPVSEDEIYASVPLERIMRRAICTDTLDSDKVGWPPSALVSRAISDAKQEMLRPGTEES